MCYTLSQKMYILFFRCHTVCKEDCNYAHF